MGRRRCGVARFGPNFELDFSEALLDHFLSGGSNPFDTWRPGFPTMSTTTTSVVLRLLPENGRESRKRKLLALFVVTLSGSEIKICVVGGGAVGVVLGGGAGVIGGGAAGGVAGGGGGGVGGGGSAGGGEEGWNEGVPAGVERQKVTVAEEFVGGAKGGGGFPGGDGDGEFEIGGGGGREGIFG